MSRRSTLVGLGTAAALTGRARAAATGPLRIGVLTDMSGPYAASGGPGSVLAARMAAAEVGDVLGQPVTIVAGDTLNKADVAGALARQWCDQGMDAMVDLPVTPVAAAVQGVAREKNVSVMVAAAAASEFTTQWCSPASTHWADDTHALASSAAAQIVRDGGGSWFFITVDMAFGAALQRDATAAITGAGGTVTGSTRFPIGTTDFSSALVEAQASGAQVVGLAAVGAELVNLVKQAGEFGLGTSARLAAFLVYATEIHALGLKVAQGLTFGSGFYWDQNDKARAWTKEFQAQHGTPPTRVHAAVFVSVRHWLRAAAQAGTRETLAVGRAMRAMPVDYMGRPGSVRDDGRVLYDLSIYRVKAPGASRAEWDLYDTVGTVPAQSAFLPAAAACRA